MPPQWAFDDHPWPLLVLVTCRYDADPFTSVCLLLAFTSIVTWMLATMVIAIITEAFVAAKADVWIAMQKSEQEKERRRADDAAWVYEHVDDATGGRTGSNAKRLGLTKGSGTMGHIDTSGIGRIHNVRDVLSNTLSKIKNSNLLIKGLSTKAGFAVRGTTASPPRVRHS